MNILIKYGKYFLILFFLCAGLSSGLSQSPYSQRPWSLAWYRRLYPKEIDSLKKILIYAKDTVRINCLNELATAYDWIKPDSEFVFARLAYKESVSSNYLEGMATSMLSIAMAKFSDGNCSIAEKYFRQAVPLVKKNNDTFQLGQCFSYLGEVLEKEGHFKDAMECYDSSISCFSAIVDSVDIAILCLLKGNVYENKGEYEKSFESYKKGLQLSIALNYGQRVLHEYFGVLYGYYLMGNLYRNVGDYETALYYYEQGKRYATRNHVTFSTETQTFEAIGIMYSLMQQYDSSLYYLEHAESTTPEVNTSIQISRGETYLMQKRYKEALNLFLVQLENVRENNNRVLVIRVLYDIGKTYTEAGQNSPALEYAYSLLPIAQETGMRQFIRDAAHLLFIIYANTNRFDSSYQYLQVYTALKDSIESKQYFFRLARNKEEAKAEKMNTEIKLLNKDKEIQEQQLSKESIIRKVLISGILALILLGTIIVRVIMLKRKNEKLESNHKETQLQQQATELEMQAFSAQMNPHFIFNCLNSIKLYTIQNDTASATEYLTKFSKLIRLVMENSAKRKILLTSELDMLGLYIDMEAMRFKEKLQYKIHIEKNVEVDYIELPPLLLQPYVENAIWHGLMPKEEGGKIDIDVEMNNDKSMLVITIKDNGIGRAKSEEIRSKSAAKHKSHGMKVTSERIALINQIYKTGADVTVHDLADNNATPLGTKVIIQIPV